MAEPHTHIPKPHSTRGMMYQKRYKGRLQNMMVQILLHLDMNQRQLADALDVTQQTISKMIRNGRPTSRQVLKIEALTGGLRGPFNRYHTRPDMYKPIIPEDAAET